MRSTPPLPDWITHKQVPGYVNAHRLVPDENRLFGTESLFGDWCGEVLLLAEIFGSASDLRDGLRSGDTRPYRHDPTRKINKSLEILASPVRGRGLLYGNALGNLLLGDEGRKKDKKEAIQYGIEVTRFVIDSMPSCRWIVCLGSVAWDVATQATGLDGNWAYHRESAEPLDRLIATNSPSARGVSMEELQRQWSAIYPDAD